MGIYVRSGKVFILFLSSLRDRATPRYVQLYDERAVDADVFFRASSSRLFFFGGSVLPEPKRLHHHHAEPVRVEARAE